jgi:hypothetical protein
MSTELSHPESLVTFKSQAPLLVTSEQSNLCFEGDELVKLVSRFLIDMGYRYLTLNRTCLLFSSIFEYYFNRESAKKLEIESGLKCHSAKSVNLLELISEGRWPDAIALTTQIKFNSAIEEIQLMIIERQFIELLEQSDTNLALELLQYILTSKGLILKHRGMPMRPRFLLI